MRTFWPAYRRGRAHATTMSPALAWAARSGSTAAIVAGAVRSSVATCRLPCAWTSRLSARARRTSSALHRCSSRDSSDTRKLVAPRASARLCAGTCSTASAQGVARRKCEARARFGREGADTAARACGGREPASARGGLRRPAMLQPGRAGRAACERAAHAQTATAAAASAGAAAASAAARMGARTGTDSTRTRPRALT